MHSIKVVLHRVTSQAAPPNDTALSCVRLENPSPLTVMTVSPGTLAAGKTLDTTGVCEVAYSKKQLSPSSAEAPHAEGMPLTSSSMAGSSVRILRKNSADRPSTWLVRNEDVAVAFTVRVRRDLAAPSLL